MRVIAWPKSKNAARNPFQSLLYRSVKETCHVEVDEFSLSQMGGRHKAEILHIHWPDAFLAAGQGWKFWPRYLILRSIFAIAWLRGTSVVWTAHNFQREGQRNERLMAKFFWPWFLRRIDGIIFMTEASKAAALRSNPALSSVPHGVIPHGHYGPIVEGIETPVTQQNESQSEILFFGSITRYKNAHKLLSAFIDMDSGDAQLAFRGKMSKTEPDVTLKNMIDALPPERAKNVTLEDRFLSDEDLIAAIKRCDLVVFPYSDVLNSGAAIFALSVGRPILASDTALFRELQQQVGADWVWLIDGELDAQQLSDALNRARDHKERCKTPDLSAFDWDHIAEQTVTFYQHVIDTHKASKT